MKLIVSTSVRKEIAKIVFTYITNIKNGWLRLSAFVEQKEEKLSIPKYSLNNVIWVSKKILNAKDLVTNDNIRFFTEPFYQENNLYCYLTTQWRFKGTKNLDITYLQKFINEEYSDLFRFEVKDDNFLFYQIHEVELITTKKIQSKFIAINKIFFGCPGTGKSYRIDQETKGFHDRKTTFHPEYDYANFMGSYKPFTDTEKKITYQFVPQIFAKIYTEAWKNLDEQYFLVIEEINRGNCASIFGDIFQLLDRDNLGFSQYFVNADSDMCQYLEKELIQSEYKTHIENLYFTKKQVLPQNPFEWLCLPHNLSILATMNTSDQSLFPMDSAFKRRWEWEYVPIDYTDAQKQVIEVGTKKYSWASFLKTINEKIYAITESEDKQMGNRFVNSQNGIISQSVLLNKIMFYLWFDIFKHEDHRSQYYIFRTSTASYFKYTDLFEGQGQEILEGFFSHHQIAESDENSVGTV